ncbi:hypothetical protein DVH24_034526 [Malus domestica]|uniref:RNase H type-1 domain-containing protein n=1 Tax=Malus domestica TaxID=3750 RepID=A0A498IWR4_MALDO|nr:hypothetical protein DVH24_034526 [Malus domestica]
MHGLNDTEAEALLAALISAVERGFDVIQVETDSKVLVDMLQGKNQPYAVIEGLLYDIKCLQMQLRLVEFIFILRNCNRAAHLMASFVSRIGGSHT